MLSEIYKDAEVNVSGTGGAEDWFSAACKPTRLSCDLDHDAAGSMAAEAISVAPALLRLTT